MSAISPTTVLVVEDEVLIRMDLVETLQTAGFLTFEAGNSAEAISILEIHPEIQVVFTDIQMPGDMDGLQLSRDVRKRWPPTIIVVCSANEKPNDDAMPSGATFVSKPYDDEALSGLFTSIANQLQA